MKSTFLSHPSVGFAGFSGEAVHLIAQQLHRLPAVSLFGGRSRGRGAVVLPAPALREEGGPLCENAKVV